MDGWEDEFGPCPMPVSPGRWYDQVAVDRALREEPVGRDLTKPEEQEVARIRAAKMAGAA